MFPDIYSILKYGFLGFLLNDFFKNNYPDKYEYAVLTGSHNLIYAFSVLQIGFNKLQNKFCDFCKLNILTNPYFSEFIQKNFENKNIKQNVEFIYNGYVNCLSNKEEILKDNDNFYKTINYDFIIYSEYDEISKTINKIIIPHFPSKQDFEYQKSEIKFILSEIIIGENTVKVYFKTDTYNYYIENNVFNQKFLIYFLNNHYIHVMNKSLDCSANNELKLKIIDHLATDVTFDSLNTLKINKTDYEKITN